MPISTSDLRPNDEPLHSKHLKRHTKPFGCTFAGCGKVFGAKNDWKRHENSQHHQLELWKCDLPSVESAGLCGKCHYRKADFVRHLKIIHGVCGSHPEDGSDDNIDPMEIIEREERRAAGPTAKDNRAIKEIIKECHIPKNHLGRFWCGFCHKTIVLHSNGSEGWDERFDHIANHFEREGRRVEGGDPQGGWEFCDDLKSKAAIDLPSRLPVGDEQGHQNARTQWEREQTMMPPHWVLADVRAPPLDSNALGNEVRWNCCKCKHGPITRTSFCSGCRHMGCRYCEKWQ